MASSDDADPTPSLRDLPSDPVELDAWLTVATKRGERLCRLHADFGPIARALLENARNAFEEYGRRLLPWIYTLGFDERGAFMVPRGPSGRSVDLSETPLPPPDFDQYNRPWRRRAAR